MSKNKNRPDQDGKATCEDAFNYAKEVGNLRKIVLHEKINDGTLNNGYLEYKDRKSVDRKSVV